VLKIFLKKAKIQPPIFKGRAVWALKGRHRTSGLSGAAIDIVKEGPGFAMSNNIGTNRSTKLFAKVRYNQTGAVKNKFYK
jgi:hypothetical protein